MSEVSLGSLTVSLTVIPRGKVGKVAPFQPQVFSNVQDAQAHAPFRLVEPTYLPSGYRLLSVSVVGSIKAIALMTYQGHGGSVFVAESTLDGYQPAADGKRTVWAAGDSISQASVGTIPAAAVQVMGDAKVAGTITLVFVSGALLLQVSTQTLTREELERIAGSMT